MSLQNSLGVILGTAQDGGVPQLGCTCTNCLKGFSNKRYRLTVSSFGIINPNSGKNYLIDATPNIIDQIRLLNETKILKNRNLAKNKKTQSIPLNWLHGIFLTHAHLGHYIGLAHLGKESCNANSIPVYATSKMIKFFSKNQPFSDLITNRNIFPQKISPGKKCVKEPGLSITPILVEHRHEYSDTVGFLIQGLNLKLLYIPDIDRLTKDIIDLISQVDVAIIDGTFHDKSDLLKRRNYNDIPHPLIKESIVIFKDLVKDTKIIFTHFNHTNPVVDPKSDAVSNLKIKGFGIAQAGQIIEL